MLNNQEFGQEIILISEHYRVNHRNPLAMIRNNKISKEKKKFDLATTIIAIPHHNYCWLWNIDKWFQYFNKYNNTNNNLK